MKKYIRIEYLDGTSLIKNVSYQDKLEKIECIKVMCNTKEFPEKENPLKMMKGDFSLGWYRVFYCKKHKKNYDIFSYLTEIERWYFV